MYIHLSAGTLSWIRRKYTYMNNAQITDHEPTRSETEENEHREMQITWTTPFDRIYTMFLK